MKLTLQKTHFVKKRMLPLLVWCVILFGFQSDLWGQVWTYNFGTGTGTATNANAGNGLTTFFPSTPSGGGTYRVRIGANGGNLILANPGTSLGTGTEAQLAASTNTATNKFGVYDWTTPTTVAYMKANIRTTSSGTGNLNFTFGINTLASDNQGYTSQYNASLASLTIAYTSGAISSVVRRSGGANATVTSSGFAKDTDQSIEVYANNGSGSTTYIKGATTYTLPTQSWDLWVAGTKISPANGWGKGGTLAAGTNFSGFGFFAETSASNAAVFYIDDLEYSNALPSVSAPTVSTTAVADVTTTSATFAGNVTATGGGNISANGTVYSLTATNANPQISGTGVTNLATDTPGTGTGIFSKGTTGLSVNTRYSYKAYATNGAGTAYGTVGNFYTLANTPDVPAVGSPTSSSLQVSIVSLAGNPATTEYAIEINGSSNYVQTDGTAVGAAVWKTAANWGTITVTGLAANTSYSFRVYARNGDNVLTAPGDAQAFSTLSATVPALTLGPLANFGNVCSNSFATGSFTLNGTNLNGTDINVSSAFGELTFSNAQNGTYNSVLLIPYAGSSVSTSVWVKFIPSFSGAYSGDIDIAGAGLSPYVVTANGNGVSPVTQGVTTTGSSAVANTIATLSGSVDALGICPTSTQKGFVYVNAAVNSNPINGGTGVVTTPVAGLATGAYSLPLTGLAQNTTYYFKAYIYDGTTYSYGTALSFTTSAAADHLFFSVDPPANGNVNTNLAAFTVQARRPDNSVDTEYNTAITLAKVTGPGNLIASAPTVAGVATFSTAQFDAVGTYTISASSGSLPTVINTVNIAIAITNSTVYSWVNASNTTAWHTATNWSSGIVPTGAVVAQWNNTGTAVESGINMGTGQPSILGIEITSLRTRNLLIGGSSATSGTLTLNGGVINAASNVILRNASNFLFTIAPRQASTGISSVTLGNTTENIINTDGTGGITISAVINGSGKNLTKAGSGTGALTLSGANTYTGTTTVNSGTLTLGGANALPLTASAGTIHFAGGTPTFNLGNFDLGTAATTAGDLDFDVNSTLNLGTGSRNYYFKGSSSQTWDATVITVNNWVGTPGSAVTGSNPKFFIGTSANLTSAQLAKFQFGSLARSGAIQLATGEIVPVVQPPSINSFPAAACAGSSIVINGLNFTNITAVSVGADAASFTANTDTSVTVTVPAGLGGAIAITTLNGGTAVSTGTLIVNALPTATISGTATVCENSTAPNITFTGAAGTAPYTFTYKVNGGANQIVSTVSGNSVNVAAATNIPGTYAYTLVSVQDSSSTTCANLQSGSATVTVTAATVYYADTDGDTFGNAASTTFSCSGAPSGFVSNNTDCNDSNANFYQLGLAYTDADGDGWDAGTGQTTVCLGITAPAGYALTTLGTDCDDTNALITSCSTAIVLNLKMFIQGYYIGGGAMNSVRFNQDFVSELTDVELMSVELHDALNYELITSTIAMLHTDGTLSASFSNAPSGSYYIVVKSDNIIQTWSAAPYSVSSTASTYDFTTGASQAYGDNMVDVGSGVYAMYSGDITHDDSIDLSDYSAWETDFNAFAFGEFITDLNGDGSVDLIDYSIWEGNFNNFIFAFYPN